MSFVSHPIIGFEYKSSWSTNKMAQERANFSNTVKVLASIPGINIIVGVARLIFSSFAFSLTRDPNKKIYFAKQICLSICEILFGPLVLIAHAIATARFKVRLVS